MSADMLIELVIVLAAGVTPERIGAMVVITVVLVIVIMMRHRLYRVQAHV